MAGTPSKDSLPLAAKPKLSLKRRRGRYADAEMAAYKKALPNIRAPKLKGEVLSKLRGTKTLGTTSGTHPDPKDGGGCFDVATGLPGSKRERTDDKDPKGGGTDLKAAIGVVSGCNEDCKVSEGGASVNRQDTESSDGGDVRDCQEGDARVRPGENSRNMRSRRGNPEVVLDCRYVEGIGSTNTTGVLPERTGKDSYDSKCLLDGAGTSSDEGLGDLFFCHLCQKDLTRFSVDRRQQHLNRCCDDAAAKSEAGTVEGGEGVKADLSCVICQKTFSNDQASHVRIHMKSCAKLKGISTAQLLDMIHDHKESGVSRDIKRPLKHQADLRSLFQKTSDGDFKAHPRTQQGRRKRGRPAVEKLDSLGDVEYEQLQLALAMSASLGVEGGGEEEEQRETRASRKRKKQKLEMRKVESLPLLTASSQQVRAIIASRAEQLLRPAAVGINQRESGDEISCTPAFGSSSLAKGVWSEGVTKRGEAKEPDEDEKLLAVSDEEDVSCASGKDEGCDAVKGADPEEGLCCTLNVRKKEDEDAMEDEECRASSNEGGDEEKSDGDREAMPHSGKNGVLGAESEGGSGDTVAGSSRRVGQREGSTSPDDAELRISGSLNPGMEKSAIGGALQATEGILPMTSFVDEMKSISYPTLWQLGACELTSDTVADFYVPALSSVVRPSKNNPLFFKLCKSEVCSVAFEPDQPQVHATRQLQTPELRVTECLTDHCNADISILLAELGSMINSPLLSDLTIVTAQGTHINAHGCILATRCPGFREAVLEREKPPQVLDLSGFPHKAVLAYLECVYCASSSSDLDERTREQVEAVAAKMSSRELISDCIWSKECEDLLRNGVAVSVSQASRQGSPSQSPVLECPRRNQALGRSLSGLALGVAASGLQQCDQMPKERYEDSPCSPACVRQSPGCRHATGPMLTLPGPDSNSHMGRYHHHPGLHSSSPEHITAGCQHNQPPLVSLVPSPGCQHSNAVLVSSGRHSSLPVYREQDRKLSYAPEHQRDHTVLRSPSPEQHYKFGPLSVSPKHQREQLSGQSPSMPVSPVYQRGRSVLLSPSPDPSLLVFSSPECQDDRVVLLSSSPESPQLALSPPDHSMATSPGRQYDSPAPVGSSQCPEHEDPQTSVLQHSTPQSGILQSSPVVALQKSSVSTPRDTALRNSPLVAPVLQSSSALRRSGAASQRSGAASQRSSAALRSPSVRQGDDSKAGWCSEVCPQDAVQDSSFIEEDTLLACKDTVDDNETLVVSPEEITLLNCSKDTNEDTLVMGPPSAEVTSPVEAPSPICIESSSSPEVLSGPGVQGSGVKAQGSAAVDIQGLGVVEAQGSGVDVEGSEVKVQGQGVATTPHVDGVQRKVSVGTDREKLWTSDSEFGEEEYDAIFGDVIDTDWNQSLPVVPYQNLVPSSQPSPDAGKEAPPPSALARAFVTPAVSASRAVLLSDSNITPTPKYHQMQTPQLKDQCAKFGVKVLPKRKMIVKLKEIYTYTHPLVGTLTSSVALNQHVTNYWRHDEAGEIVPEDSTASKPQTLESLQQEVRHLISSDKELYRSILLYQPLELGMIHERLKARGLSVARDKLADVLDFMCVTFTEPRPQRNKKTS